MLGELLSIGSAIAWAAAVIFYKLSGSVHPEAMNLFKNVFGVVAIGLTMLVVGTPVDMHRSDEDWIRLLGSGVLGIAIADTMLFAALAQLRASVMAVVETTYAPAMVLMSVAFLGEPIGWSFLFGGLLVVTGVFLASYDFGKVAGAPAPDNSGRNKAILLGVASIVLMCAGVIMAKPAVDRGDLLEVTFIRFLAGVGGQLIFIAPRRAARRHLRIFIPQPSWWTLVPGSFFGGYVAMICWLGGIKYTTVSLAGVLGQLATIFTLIFARLFLDEPLTRWRIAGGILAVSGSLVLMT